MSSILIVHFGKHQKLHTICSPAQINRKNLRPTIAYYTHSYLDRLSYIIKVNTMPIMN